MPKVAVFSFALVLIASGCSESSTSNRGVGGTAGTGGMGGTPPPPAAVDQTCRDLCANEAEGFSCFQGPPDMVQACYEQCLRDYQAYVPCGGEWIAIYDCLVDLDCADLFGDCESTQAQLNECVRRENNRMYCEANCPQLDIAQCQQDITECRRLVEARAYCGVRCRAPELEDCIAEYPAPTPCDPLPGPVNQCVNDADQSALDALATDELSGPAIVGMIAGDCPLNACTSEIGALLSENSPDSRDALANCIASCISDQTNLSIACTGCYGSITACSTAFCYAPCLPPNSSSQECAACGVENCINLEACTGFD